MSYDPTIGRFISEDPIAFDGGDANLYRFVGNSPTNATDPTGMFGDPVQGMTPSHNRPRPRPNLPGGPIGVPTAVGGVLVGAGLPTVGKPVHLGGAQTSTNTSIASTCYRKILGNRQFPRWGQMQPGGGRLPLRLPAPTMSVPLGKTTFIATFLGRWTPVAGWCLIGYDITRGYIYFLVEVVAPAQAGKPPIPGNGIYYEGPNLGGHRY
jgi:hypothetical protein